ncbi:MAG: DUF4038 domain-containing protein [Chloroflexota bacterium]
MVERYGLFEAGWRAESLPADPFGVEWQGRFVHEGGEAWQVPGFYDGEGTYRLRFMPARPGTYRYEVEAPGELRLTGELSGEFECAPSGARGPLRQAPETHHFQYASGERAFILGNTAYNLVAAYLRAPDEARDFVAYYAQRNVNWVRFFLQQVTWDSHGYVVWPWGGTPEAPDFTTYRLETFQAAEAVIELLAEHGCTASVILLHPADTVFDGRQDLVSIFRRYVRYAVARLGAHANVVWNIANEWERRFVLTAQDVEAIGSYLQTIDPYAHLTSVHHYGRFEFPRRPWVDMSSMQHRGLPHEINRVAVANRAFGKPVLNEEYGYEGDTIAPPNDPVNVRRDHWALTMAGAYGTYGDKTKGPKIAAYFSSTLGDSVGAVVPDTLRHIPTLMARTRYWELQPMNELLSGCLPQEVFCLARPGAAYVVYLAVGQNVSLDLSHVDAETLRYSWWNPRTGEVGPTVERPRHERERRWGSAAIRAPVLFSPPDYEHDWVLHVDAEPPS